MEESDESSVKRPKIDYKISNKSPDAQPLSPILASSNSPNIDTSTPKKSSLPQNDSTSTISSPSSNNGRSLPNSLLSSLLEKSQNNSPPPALTMTPATPSETSFYEMNISSENMTTMDNTTSASTTPEKFPVNTPATGTRHRQQHIDAATISTICAKCRIDFVDVKNLRSHFLKYKNQAQFPCELCHKSYIRHDVLQEHARVHTNENLYKCVKCFYSCNQIYDLYEHMHTVHKLNVEKIFKCPYDDIMFRNKSRLFKHIKFHRVDEKIEESERNKSNDDINDEKNDLHETNFQIKQELSDNETGDENDKPLPCLVECNLEDGPTLTSNDDNISNNNASNRFGHSLSTTTESNQTLDEIDQSTLIDIDYVKNNMVINMEKFADLNSESDHRLRELSCFRNIKCAYCTKRFESKNELKVHLVTAHDSSRKACLSNDKNEKFECTICSIKFDFNIDLTHHTSKEHTKYACERCNKVYNHAYTLKKHMNMCLAASVASQCQPNSSGRPPSASATSVASAAGGGGSVKPSVTNIVCDICEKTFKRNWNLKQHMINIHKIGGKS